MYKEIETLLNYGVEHGLIQKIDQMYVRNQILKKLNLDDYQKEEPEQVVYIQDLLDRFVDYAVKEMIVQDERYEKEQFEEELMGLLTPMPSTINLKFMERYNESPVAATDYYYELSKSTNYIKTKQILNNRHWISPTDYGDLEMTINLSKPEKDPKEIEKLKHMPKSGYPSCLLCYENIGYKGRLNHPIRLTHRVVPIELDGEDWFMQYSPYSYYNEHSIIVDMKHQNMMINRSTFEKMIDFLEEFPHYFVGSNADLPIVGGSILNHNHFQSGRYVFPLNNAKAYYEEEVGSVKIQALNWPMATIKLLSKDREALTELAEKLLNHWGNYEDSTINVFNKSYKEHNTITPIARQVDDVFELYMVLRNNYTTEEVPYGLFHPREDYHHLKKENIGLIEVMGLSILPGRLVLELDEIKEAIMSGKQTIDSAHNEWYQELRNKHDGQNVDQFIKDEVGLRFAKVLDDCHVFRFAVDQKAELVSYIKKFMKE